MTQRAASKAGSDTGKTAGQNPAAQPADSAAGQPDVLEIYRLVSLARAAELRIRRHIDTNGFGGFWHPGIGQEGLQVGAVSALRRDDLIFYAHRGLAYALAKGMSPVALFGDLFGRQVGSTGGKGGGTVHFVDPSVGVMGQGGTLGSGFVMGAGTAISSQLLGIDRVTAIFFGDGAAARGEWHEAALQASVWHLPVIWICENNGWALSAPFSEQSPTPNIADRASAYGVPGVIVDGQDALAMYEAVTQAVARARAGQGPTLIEAKTLRIRGHYEGDPQPYRDDLDEGDEIPRDPVQILRERLPAGVADQIDEACRAEIEEAFDAALSSPRPSPDIILKDVWTP
jgi:TPP-dependent pyruvate/acetoin dehydrogenase alpha subunit